MAASACWHNVSVAEIVVVGPAVVVVVEGLDVFGINGLAGREKAWPGQLILWMLMLLLLVPAGDGLSSQAMHLKSRIVI